jgi:N-formylglutamate amidohydrolase
MIAMDPRFQALDIPGVLTVTPPAAAPAPLVYDSPHSGLVIPADFRPAVAPALVLKASDTHVDALFDAAPGVGAPYLTAQFPRSFLDANRSVLDVDPDMLDGAWPHPRRDSATAKRGMGLSWRYAWEDIPMHAGPIPVAEMEARIERYWRPYHATLKALLDATHAAYGVVYHVDCHSMPAVGHRLSPDPAGTVRPDVVVGDYDGQACEPGFSALVAETLAGFGLAVVMNKPFRGAELVSAYSDPAAGRHALQIEVNRKLYMDEETREKTAGFADLKDKLDRLAVVVADYARAHAKG